MAVNLCTELQVFDKFIQNNAALDDNTRLVLDGGNENGGIMAGAADAGLLKRNYAITDRGAAGANQAEDNRDIRRQLMDALNTEFQHGIPESVTKALKGSGIFGDSDMKTNAKGKVISTRPLTLRRIKAVLNAAKTELEARFTPSKVDPDEIKPKITTMVLAYTRLTQSTTLATMFNHTRFAETINQLIEQKQAGNHNNQWFLNQLAAHIESISEETGCDLAQGFGVETKREDFEADGSFATHKHEELENKLMEFLQGIYDARIDNQA